MASKGEFVKLNYTGKVKEDGMVFDTTSPEVAKEHGLEAERTYEPVVICLGQGQILPGLDDELEGKEKGKHTIEVEAAKAFGKKDASLIELIPLSKFKEAKINPVPGLQVQFDDQLGTVRRAGGGRVLVDFNHPLAGKDLVYEVTIEDTITDKKEQTIALSKSMFGLEPEEVKIQEKKITVKYPKELPEQITKPVGEKWAELLKVDKVEFTAPKEEKKDTTKE